MDPTPTRFAALARSSPWRWTTVRFVLEERMHGRSTAVRGWVGRPDRLRVEELDGTVLVAGRERREASPWPPSVPEFDADGLVRAPRDLMQRFAHDAPMWQDYRWVAMLDPVELADGADADGQPGPPPVVVDALTAVEHHGRPAWEAVLRTTPFYDPRCSCCPLLLSPDSDALETAMGVPSIVERVSGLRFADAHRVRLDVATGVCVFTAEIGGDRPGEGHDLRIEEVDGEVPAGSADPAPARQAAREDGPPVPGLAPETADGPAPAGRPGSPRSRQASPTRTRPLGAGGPR